MQIFFHLNNYITVDVPPLLGTRRSENCSSNSSSKRQLTKQSPRLPWWLWLSIISLTWHALQEPPWSQNIKIWEENSAMAAHWIFGCPVATDEDVKKYVLSIIRGYNNTSVVLLTVLDSTPLDAINSPRTEIKRVHLPHLFLQRNNEKFILYRKIYSAWTDC